MQKLSSIFWLLLVCILTSGCDVGGYLNYARGIAGDYSNNADAPLLASGPVILKTSPGHISSTSASGALRATVTPTTRLVQSAGMSAKFSIHAQHVTP